MARNSGDIRKAYRDSGDRGVSAVSEKGVAARLILAFCRSASGVSNVHWGKKDIERTDRTGMRLVFTVVLFTQLNDRSIIKPK